MTKKTLNTNKIEPMPTMADLTSESFMEETVTEAQKEDINDPEDDGDEEGLKPQKPKPGEVRPSRIRQPYNKHDQDQVVVRETREDDGKFRKMIPLELQGLTSGMLPPMTKRKTATYKVIGAEQIDPLTGEYVSVPPVYLPGGYTVFDVFEKNLLRKRKYIKNVVKAERMVRNGVEMIEEVVSDIELHNGEIIVNIEKDYLLYVLLELHPLNKSNRYRDTSQAPTFFRADLQAHRKEWLERSEVGMNMALEAEKTVVALKRPEDILMYAHACGIVTANRSLEGGYGSVKYDLRVFARNDPKAFFSVNKLSDYAVRINVLDAVNLGLLEYNLDRREWSFSTDGTIICRHLPSEDNIDYLVKCFSKADDEGYQRAYELVVSQLNYWE